MTRPLTRAEIAQLVFERDDRQCAHCGISRHLSIQHRRGRGAGGSKRLEGPENKTLLCWVHNSRIEGDYVAAEEARQLGWKVDRFDPREAWEVPIWHKTLGWRQLLPNGQYLLIGGPDDVRPLPEDTGDWPCA